MTKFAARTALAILSSLLLVNLPNAQTRFPYVAPYNAAPEQFRERDRRALDQRERREFERSRREDGRDADRPQGRDPRRGQDRGQRTLASGEADLGPSNIRDRGELRTTVPLTRRYASPPRIVVTPHAHPNDFITAIVTEVTTDSFNVWAWRLNGGPWSANLKLYWIEISEPEP